MLRYLIICFFYLVSLFAEEEKDFPASSPEEISSLNFSELIGGVVSPLSGQVVIRKTDLIAKGAQEISLDRIYIPPCRPVVFNLTDKERKDKKNRTAHSLRYLHNNIRTDKKWVVFPQMLLQVTYSGCVRYTDPNGITLEYDSSWTLKTPSYAMNNVQGELPSGKYDLRNTRIGIEGEQYVIYAPDGTIRYYSCWYQNRNGYFYTLQKEILPSGKVLSFRPSPTTIESTGQPH